MRHRVGLVSVPFFALCVILSLAASQVPSVQASDPPDDSVFTVTTSDGKTLAGQLLGDQLSVQTAFGTQHIDARQIRLYSPAGMHLTNGTVLTGSVSILEGQVRVRTDKGIVTTQGRLVHSIQGQGGYLSTAPPAGPAPGDEASTAALLLGRWQDSNGATWEFLKDGTVTQGNASLRYTFPDHRHLKIHVGQAGAAVGMPGMQGGAMPTMGGIGLDRVYEIASAGQSKVLLKYQGNDLTLTRIR